MTCLLCCQHKRHSSHGLLRLRFFLQSKSSLAVAAGVHPTRNVQKDWPRLPVACKATLIAFTAFRSFQTQILTQIWQQTACQPGLPLAHSLC